MDFIKRNLGFLLFLAAALVVPAVLAVLWWQTAAETARFRQQVQEQEKFLDGVRRGQFALNQDNVQVAKRNQALTEEAFREFVRTLTVRYGLPARTGVEPLECVRIVKDQRERMEKELTDPAKKITVSQGARNFSFDAILSSSTPPLAADVPVILKQLQIVGEIVRAAATSPGLREFGGISRPLGLAAADQDLYQVVPLEVSVSGNFKSIQRFVNQLQQRQTAGIFVLRSIELTSRDQAAGNLMGSEMTGGGPGVPGPGREFMMPAGMPGVRTPAAVRPPAGTSVRGDRRTGEPAVEEAAETGPALLAEEKDRRTVFSTHDLDARILIDFVEFKKPPEET